MVQKHVLITIQCNAIIGTTLYPRFKMLLGSSPTEKRRNSKLERLNICQSILEWEMKTGMCQRKNNRTKNGL